jgi:hypothetical protein
MCLHPLTVFFIRGPDIVSVVSRQGMVSGIASTVSGQDGVRVVTVLVHGIDLVLVDVE